MVAALPRALVTDFQSALYHTACQVHYKIMQAMSEREEAYVLRGKVQVDNAYAGGER